MKILVISQYFYPENFRINDLCYSLSNRGHEITILTGKPNYPKGEYFDGYSWRQKQYEKIKNIEVYRSNLLLRRSGRPINLIFNYLSFALLASIKIFKISKKFDKIFIYAPSPITVGIVGIIAKYRFKVKTYLWVHDLWPESVQFAGGINSKIILYFIDIMTRIIYKLNDILLVQSPLFESYLLNQNVNLDKIIYYPYYAEDFYKPVLMKEEIKRTFPEGFNLVFAGNIGKAQSFDTIIMAAAELKKKKIKINFIIFGDGRDKKRIESLIKQKELESYFYFKGSFPPQRMPDLFSCADALLVTLKKSEVFSKTIPGKLQSYLACGKPIVGALDGIGAEIILSSKSGFSSKAEDYKSLSEIILKISRLSGNQLQEFGKNALSYYSKFFEKEKLLNELEEIFNKK